jgi:hypothetical protein
MIIQIRPFRILFGTVADWEQAAYERGALATTLRRHSGASEASRAGWATRREKRTQGNSELDRTSEANHNQK